MAWLGTRATSRAPRGVALPEQPRGRVAPHPGLGPGATAGRGVPRRARAPRARRRAVRHAPRGAAGGAGAPARAARAGPRASRVLPAVARSSPSPSPRSGSSAWARCCWPPRGWGSSRTARWTTRTISGGGSRCTATRRASCGPRSGPGSCSWPSRSRGSSGHPSRRRPWLPSGSRRRSGASWRRVRAPPRGWPTWGTRASSCRQSDSRSSCSAWSGGAGWRWATPSATRRPSRSSCGRSATGRCATGAGPSSTRCGRSSSRCTSTRGSPCSSSARRPWWPRLRSPWRAGGARASAARCARSSGRAGSFEMIPAEGTAERAAATAGDLRRLAGCEGRPREGLLPGRLHRGVRGALPGGGAPAGGAHRRVRQRVAGRRPARSSPSTSCATTRRRRPRMPWSTSS